MPRQKKNRKIDSDSQNRSENNNIPENGARKVLYDYCDSSTIHGVKYIGTRPLKEK